MITFLQLLFGLIAAAGVPYVGQFILLSGIAVPRWWREDGRLPPLIAVRGEAIGGQIGRLSLEVVGPVHAIAVALGPNDIARHLIQAFERDQTAIVDRIAGNQLGLIWRTLPGAAKVQFEDYFARAVPRAIERALDEIIQAVDDLVDVPGMLARYFGANQSYLAQMVRSVAGPAFGALVVIFPLLSLLPLVLIDALPGLAAPLAGAVLGLAVAAACVAWMFTPPPGRWRPRLPSWCITPLLPEREIITKLYADNVAYEVFRIDAVIDELVEGRAARSTRAIVERRAGRIFANLPGRPLLSLVIPPRAMQGMIDAATDELLTLLQQASRDPAFMERCAVRLHEHVRGRFDALDEMAFLTVQRGVLRAEIPLLYSGAAALFFALGCLAMLL